MFSKFERNKNSLNYNIILRFFITYPLVLLVAAFMIAYILNSSTDEIKYNLRIFNDNIQKTALTFINNAQKELELQSEFLKHYQVHHKDEPVKIIRTVNFEDYFDAVFYIDKNASLLGDERSLISEMKVSENATMPKFDTSWVLNSFKGKPTFSNFAYKDGKFNLFYISLYVDDGTRLVAQINVENMLKKVKEVINENEKKENGKYSTYTVDYNGMILKDISNVEVQDIQVKDVDDYFTKDGVVNFSYSKLNASLISYNDILKSFVITYTSSRTEILFQFVMFLMAGGFLVAYSYITYGNIAFAWKNVRRPVIELSEYVKDKSKKPFVGTISEYVNIYEDMKSMHNQIDLLNENLSDCTIRYNAIFQENPQILLIIDLYSGHIAEANQAALRFYGYTSEEIRQLNISDISQVSFADNSDLSKNAVGNFQRTINDMHILKNDEIHHVQVKIFPIRLSDKRFAYLRIKDMADEAQIGIKDEDVKKYFKLFPNIMLIAKLKEPFKIINSTANVDLFGYDQAEIRRDGFDIRQIIADQNKTNFENEIEINKHILQTSTSITRNSLKLQTNAILAGEGEVAFKVQVNFEGDDTGIKDIVYLFIRNDEEYQTFNKFQSNIAYLNNIVWSSNVATLDYDANSKILRSGEVFSVLLGLSATNEIVANYEYFSSILVDEFDDFDDFFARLKLENGTYDGVVRMYNKDEKMLWIRIKAKATKFDKDGRILTISGTARNVTVQKNALIYQNLAAKIFSYTSDPVALLDLDFNFIDANDAFSYATGYSLNELLGADLLKILHSKLNTSSDVSNIKYEIEKEGSWYGKLWHRRKNGEDYLDYMSVEDICDDLGNVICYMFISNISSKKQISSDYLEHIAYHDPLTKLPNRFLLNQKLEELMRTPDNNRKLAIIYIDMDGFKAIKDSYGHKYADQILLKISSNIDALFDDRDMFARIGGDEFVAIALHEHIGQVYEVIEHILKIASEDINIDNISFNISVSVGVSVIAKNNKVTPETLLEQANWAMYQAKMSGKNQYYLFDASKDRNLRDRYNDNNKILNGIKHNEFFMEYQPEIDIVNSEVVAFEALIRWRNDGKILNHDDFLPYIRQQNIADELMIYALSKVFRAQEKWRQNGLNIRVSVNLSIEQITSEGFYKKFLQLIKGKNNLNLQNLMIEIIDANLIKDLENAIKYIKRYQSMGIKFALDDFTSKSSSFETFQLLPIDKIKVDKNICKYLLSNQKAFATLEIIRDLLNIFSEPTTIKNIKDLNTLNILVGLGFSNYQGNFFAKAMSDDAVLRYEFGEIQGLDKNNVIDDKRLEFLKNTIALREFSLNIINLLKDPEFSANKKDCSILKQKVLRKIAALQNIKNDKHIEIIAKLQDAIQTENPSDKIALARSANLMCMEILNINDSESFI
ncbi:MAG: EAL domain-containing protein [Campylobacter sp.]|nr:EAL domain-containing protein [Campylobacter sp.]